MPLDILAQIERYRLAIGTHGNSIMFDFDRGVAFGVNGDFPFTQFDRDHDGAYKRGKGKSTDRELAVMLTVLLILSSVSFTGYWQFVQSD